MPELPDIVVYVEQLARRVVGQPLNRVRLINPFVLRSVEPALAAAEGKKVLAVTRIGKRIVLGLEEDLFLVIHLMVLGRLNWKPPGTKPSRKGGLVAFDFPEGTLVLTESGSKRRASLHLVKGRSTLRAFERGGLEVLEADLASFQEALLRENHTLKRTLTDPRLFSGIGNAYSDEILHKARLSPVQWTTRLSGEEIARLFDAVREVLTWWVDHLGAEAGEKFPTKVTAFRTEMAVHGRFGKPCPDCGDPVQRIVYAENETNYCATCQTGGKLLADRALSRLLKRDWPKTVAELEERTTRSG